MELQISHLRVDTEQSTEYHKKQSELMTGRKRGNRDLSSDGGEELSGKALSKQANNLAIKEEQATDPGKKKAIQEKEKQL